MTYLIAVDVGIKNLGLVVYNCVDKRVCVWKRVDITEGEKYTPSKNVQYVHKLINAHAAYFAGASAVLIERQMRVNMRIIEAVVESVCYGTSVVIGAQSVKMHFSICMRNYKANKKRAVEWLQCHWGTFLPKFITNLDEIEKLWDAESKKDDLADSMLMLLYYLNTYKF
jgi:hypothetical protein